LAPRRSWRCFPSRAMRGRFLVDDGQTADALVMQIRLVTCHGQKVKPARAIVRSVAMNLAALPLFAGYLPILFRRGNSRTGSPTRWFSTRHRCHPPVRDGKQCGRHATGPTTAASGHLAINANRAHLSTRCPGCPPPHAQFRRPHTSDKRSNQARSRSRHQPNRAPAPKRDMANAASPVLLLSRKGRSARAAARCKERRAVSSPPPSSGAMGALAAARWRCGDQVSLTGSFLNS
jgi:hypothetical protein